MKRCFLWIALMAYGFLFLGASSNFWKNHWVDKLPVNEVLEKLGAPRPAHSIIRDTKQIEIGKALVTQGQVVLENGKMSRPISKYFVCTNCHNSEREDFDIHVSDPDMRLPYVVEKGLPFLQGTTFWGIVNRESWYNDDYYLKYGEHVKAANKSLRKAIQLCAIECSQGRPLEQWEEDGMLAYFWTLEMKMSDLGIPIELQDKVSGALNDGRKNPTLISEIKSYYLQGSPATFGKVLENKVEGYEENGDPIVGQMVYEYSCRHCHAEGGVSDFLLDYSPQTFKYMEKHMFESSDLSIYQIIRKGTYASPGARPYMPHYPEEKMSNKQIEGLRAFILSQTK